MEASFLTQLLMGKIGHRHGHRQRHGRGLIQPKVATLGIGVKKKR
jgi:hypothetical protein